MYINELNISYWKLGQLGKEEKKEKNTEVKLESQLHQEGIEEVFKIITTPVTGIYEKKLRQKDFVEDSLINPVILDFQMEYFLNTLFIFMGLIKFLGTIIENYCKTGFLPLFKDFLWMRQTNQSIKAELEDDIIDESNFNF